MKNLLFFLNLFLIAIDSFAESFIVGDLKYIIMSSNEDKTAYILNGENATGDVFVPETVTYNDVEYKVTGIVSQAFKGNEDITSIEMPSITRVDQYAFYGCSSLTSASLPMVTFIGESAFAECSSLSNVSMPTVTVIGSYAFHNTSLTSVTFPEVYSVGYCAFAGCESLTSVSLPAVTSIEHQTFQGCSSLTTVSIPSAISIGKCAFLSCSSLNFVSLNAVSELEERAFDGCKNICSLRIGSIEQWFKVKKGGYMSNPLQATSQQVNLYIGDSDIPIKKLEVSSTITDIPDYAFSHTTIDELTVTTVKTIGNYAFYGCSSLTSVYFPVATSTGDYSFYKCESLTDVSMPKVEVVGDYAFTNSTDHWDRQPNASLINVTLPSATSIGKYAFYGTSLTSIYLPEAIIIGDHAFGECGSLEKAIIPKAECLGESAFEGVYYSNGTRQSSLKIVDLSSLSTSNDYAFHGCKNICSIRIGSVEQWCKINFCSNEANPLDATTQSVDLYIGDSNIPAKKIEVPNNITNLPIYAFKNTTISEFSAPSVIYEGYESFRNCSLLVSVSLPVAESVGYNAFRECSSLVSVNIPVAKYIGGYSFYGCSSLTSITFSEATSIGEYAFYGCKSLASANFPVAASISDYAFNYNRSLFSVNVPNVTTIGRSAFEGCYALTHLELPEVKEIGMYALFDLSSLKYLSIPKAEKVNVHGLAQLKIDSLRIGSIAQYCNIDGESPLYGSYVTKTNYIFIGDSETPATEITLPKSVTKIPPSAFKGTLIHTIHFESTTPPKLTNTSSFPTWTMLAVPDEAYETYLAADNYKTIPLQITKEKLTTDTVNVEAKDNISNLLAKIGHSNVRYIVNLKVNGTINSYDMLIIRNQMTSLRNLDLTEASIVDCDYEYSNTDGLSYHSIKDVVTADWMNNLMNVKLPATTKLIDDMAFYGCEKLVNINIPYGVTSIGSKAFYDCESIEDLTLPQSVISFGEYAFSGCTGLKEVVIPNGVTSVNSYAFYGCTDLEKVTIPASVKEIGRSAFANYKPITLNISSIDEWKDINFIGYYREDGAFRDVKNLYVGNSAEPTEAIVIPEGTTRLKDFTFAGFNCIKSVSFPAELDSIGYCTFSNCSGISSISLPDSLSHIESYAFYNSGLKEINIPKKVKAINSYTFSDCRNLEKIEFTDSLKSIKSYAFRHCDKLAKIELPSYLSTIGSYAFENCTGLEEILIPASITEIQDYAFQGCTNLNKVIAVTVEPIAINQNTFSTYRTASVYSPRTSYWKYYWNTQWNQFLSINEYGKHRYKYFYLRGRNGKNKEDFEIDNETGIINGIIDPEFSFIEKAPDADFGEESGIIVGGEQIQELGDIHIHHNGNNGASVITKQDGKVHINNLYVDIKVQKNRWYFFCFPFDINPGEAKFGGSYVWYLYDGETRAINGNGGWKKVAADGVMKSGNGYIFQGAVNGTLSIHVKDVTIDASDSKTNLITYLSNNKNDASWNLIGNPYAAYYDMDNLDYEAPITVYDNETGNYEAVRPGDDDYEFYPFQAFFVQKPEGKDKMNFDGSKKDTKNKADQKKARKAAARANAPRKVDSLRKVINLELASRVDTESESAPADRTRIVINPTKSLGYETDCDAAKFVADNMSQIYSLDNEGSTYAINERPMENGVVNIAVKAAKKAFLTISASRLDCGAKLRDLATGEVVDLAESGYTFATEATTYTNRFQLILGGEATSVSAPEVAMDAVAVENGAICVSDPNANVKVYSAGGALVASQKGAGRITVPVGVYVVSVNSKNMKVTVKE